MIPILSTFECWTKLPAVTPESWTLSSSIRLGKYVYSVIRCSASHAEPPGASCTVSLLAIHMLPLTHAFLDTSLHLQSRGRRHR